MKIILFDTVLKEKTLLIFVYFSQHLVLESRIDFIEFGARLGCVPPKPHLRQLCLAAACLQIFALFLLTSISLFLLTSISLFLFRSISLFLLTSISLILVYNYLQVEVQSLGIESAKVSFQFLLYIFTNCQCELSSEHTWYLTLGGVDFNLFNTSFIFYFWTLGGVDFIFLSTPGGMDFAYISQ